MEDEGKETLGSDNSLSVFTEKKVRCKRQWLGGTVGSKDEWLVGLLFKWETSAHVHMQV